MSFNTEINRNFFYCRDANYKDFLLSKGFHYICRGLHIKTKHEFYLFQRTDELNKVLYNNSN